MSRTQRAGCITLSHGWPSYTRCSSRARISAGCAGNGSGRPTRPLPLSPSNRPRGGFFLPGGNILTWNILSRLTNNILSGIINLSHQKQQNNPAGTHTRLTDERSEGVQGLCSAAVGVMWRAMNRTAAWRVSGETRGNVDTLPAMQQMGIGLCG